MSETLLNTLERLSDISTIKFDVNPHALAEEVTELPGDVATMAAKLSEVTEMYGKAKLALERVKASVRQQIVDQSAKKPNLDDIKAQITLYPQVVEASDIVEALSAVKSKLSYHKEALDAKGHSLARLVSLKTSEMKNC